MLFPLFAGVYYWYPSLTDKRLSDRLGKVAFWLMFTGFNVAFLPMHWTGVLGMPRRVWTYPAGLGWETLNMVSTVGAFVFAAGFAVFAFEVLRPKGREPYVERNIWGAGTMEWSEKVPGETWGARTIPHIKTRYPLWEQENFLKDYDEGRFYLPDAEELKRETIVTSILDADPMQCLRVPGPTYKTLLAALALGMVFIFGTYHWWYMAIGSGLLFVAALIWWLWTGTSPIPEKDVKDVGLGVTLPLYRSGSDSVGWWAMCITMVGDMTAFFGLVFAYFFFWTIHPEFPRPGADAPHLGLLVLGMALATAGWAGIWVAHVRHHAGGRGWARFAMPAAGLVALLGVAAFAGAAWVEDLSPTRHAYDATIWVMILWMGAHVGVGLIMLGYCSASSFAGRMTPKYDADSANVLLYWHFMFATVAVTFALFALFPLLTGEGP